MMKMTSYCLTRRPVHVAIGVLLVLLHLLVMGYHVRVRRLLARVVRTAHHLLLLLLMLLVLHLLSLLVYRVLLVCQ